MWRLCEWVVVVVAAAVRSAAAVAVMVVVVVKDGEGRAKGIVRAVVVQVQCRSRCGAVVQWWAGSALSRPWPWVGSTTAVQYGSGRGTIGSLALSGSDSDRRRGLLGPVVR